MTQLTTITNNDRQGLDCSPVLASKLNYTLLVYPQNRDFRAKRLDGFPDDKDSPLRLLLHQGATLTKEQFKAARSLLVASKINLTTTLDPSGMVLIRLLTNSSGNPTNLELQISKNELGRFDLQLCGYNPNPDQRVNSAAKPQLMGRQEIRRNRAIFEGMAIPHLSKEVGIMDHATGDLYLPLMTKELFKAQMEDRFSFSVNDAYRRTHNTITAQTQYFYDELSKNGVSVEPFQESITRLKQLHPDELAPLHKELQKLYENYLVQQNPNDAFEMYASYRTDRISPFYKYDSDQNIHSAFLRFVDRAKALLFTGTASTIEQKKHRFDSMINSFEKLYDERQHESAELRSFNKPNIIIGPAGYPLLDYRGTSKTTK